MLHEVLETRTFYRVEGPAIHDKGNGQQHAPLLHLIRGDFDPVNKLVKILMTCFTALLIF